MERVSKTCHFKSGQYHLALLISPQEDAYEHLFKGHPSYLGLEEAYNRSLPYCRLLGDLWKKCHAWITHGIVSGSFLMTDRLRHTR